MGTDRKSKEYSNAWAISDRSGLRFHKRDMIREPGTGYLVHKSESDGMWNYVDHPQAHINEYANFGDPFPVENARPDINWFTDTLMTDENGSPIQDSNNDSLDFY